MQKQQKQATRGQKQIHDENKQTIIYYFVATILTVLLVFSLNVFVFTPTTNGPWIGLAISCFFEFFSLLMMFKMMKTVRNEKNQIIDAGMDLNDPAAFGEYFKDIIIVSSISQIASLLSVYLYFIIVVIPFFAFYKLWTSVLAPWFFAPAEEDDDKKLPKNQKKREKVMKVRR